MSDYRHRPPEHYWKTIGRTEDVDVEPDEVLVEPEDPDTEPEDVPVEPRILTQNRRTCQWSLRTLTQNGGRAMEPEDPDTELEDLFVNSRILTQNLKIYSWNSRILTQNLKICCCRTTGFHINISTRTGVGTVLLETSDPLLVVAVNAENRTGKRCHIIQIVIKPLHMNQNIIIDTFVRIRSIIHKNHVS
jgi:hypothetical protein